MGIPTVKRIAKELGIDRSDARIIREAMEWAEYDEASTRLRTYYRNEVYSLNSGLYHDLDDYRFGDVHVALQIIDRVLDTHGVEYIASNDDDYTRGRGIDYANTGDAYGWTVMYDYDKHRWLLGSWGNEVEADEKRFGDESGW